MAGERTFTEGEAYALVADGIERETAAANSRIAELEAQVTSLGNEKDALEVRVTAAEGEADTAKQELEDYKAEQEREKAAEAKRTERIAKVAEVAPTLAEDMSDERATRIVAMDDATFDEYVASLKAVAPQPSNKSGSTAAADATAGGPPRESAAFKGGGAGSESKPSVSGLFGAKRALSRPAAK